MARNKNYAVKNDETLQAALLLVMGVAPTHLGGCLTHRMSRDGKAFSLPLLRAIERRVNRRPGIDPIEEISFLQNLRAVVVATRVGGAPLRRILATPWWLPFDSLGLHNPSSHLATFRSCSQQVANSHSNNRPKDASPRGME